MVNGKQPALLYDGHSPDSDFIKVCAAVAAESEGPADARSFPLSGSISYPGPVMWTTLAKDFWTNYRPLRP